MRKLVLVLIIPAFVVSVTFIASSGLTAAAKGNAAKGKKLYAQTKCQVCHGVNGKGDGPAAKSLKPPPTNFADAKRMSKRTDKQLFNVLKNGGPAEKLAATMPAYKDKLKDAEINDVVTHLRTLAKK